MIFQPLEKDCDEFFDGCHTLFTEFLLYRRIYGSWGGERLVPATRPEVGRVPRHISVQEKVKDFFRQHRMPPTTGWECINAFTSRGLSWGTMDELLLSISHQLQHVGFLFEPQALNSTFFPHLTSWLDSKGKVVFHDGSTPPENLYAFMATWHNVYLKGFDDYEELALTIHLSHDLSGKRQHLDDPLELTPPMIYVSRTKPISVINYQDDVGSHQYVAETLRDNAARRIKGILGL